MSKYKKLFTSESVGAGHPDKICDQISDGILDAILKQDPESRVACEVMASNRLIIIGGEITTKAYVDFIQEAWNVVKPLGYSENDFTIISNVNSQSPDINQGVDKTDGEIGAGDQGIMFGYANKETKEYMPLPIVLSHKLMELAEKLRKSGEFVGAGSDMKAQVTIDYTEVPKIDTILMSVQHTEETDLEIFKEFIENNIMKVVADEYGLNTDYKVFINPTGKFVIGGPVGDSGLTGRKIIVDTYGGKGRHGGGAFSGKDYTKVDRSGAYAARHVAKNLVAAGIADEIEVQLSYAIGISQPTSVNIVHKGGNHTEEEIANIVSKVFDLSAGGIIKALDLKKPIYKQTATFGHFGRDELNLPWEKLDKVEEIKALMK